MSGPDYWNKNSQIHWKKWIKDIICLIFWNSVNHHTIIWGRTDAATYVCSISTPREMDLETNVQSYCNFIISLYRWESGRKPHWQGASDEKWYCQSKLSIHRKGFWYIIICQLIWVTPTQRNLPPAGHKGLFQISVESHVIPLNLNARSQCLNVVPIFHRKQWGHIAISIGYMKPCGPSKVRMDLMDIADGLNGFVTVS